MGEREVQDHQFLWGRVPGKREVELCADEESLLSLVLGAQDGVREVKSAVKSRSKFSGCTILSCAQVVMDSGGKSSRGGLGSSYGVGGGGGRRAHRKGACCISEHKDRKSMKEKEQAGREGNNGV